MSGVTFSLPPASVTADRLATDVPFRESYESAEQTITVAGLLSLAHGLTAKPALMQFVLKCKTAQYGYSVDDEVVINPHRSGASTVSSGGIAVVADATNIVVRYANSSSVFYVLDKSTGNLNSLTNANWALIVRAWA